MAGDAGYSGTYVRFECDVLPPVEKVKPASWGFVETGTLKGIACSSSPLRFLVGRLQHLPSRQPFWPVRLFEVVGSWDQLEALVFGRERVVNRVRVAREATDMAWEDRKRPWKRGVA